MKTITKFIGAALLSATTLGSLPAAAASFHGEFWDIDPAVTNIATIDQAITAVGGGAAATTATFTSTSISYGDGPGWIIGSLSDFLNADAGSIVGTDPSNMQESVFRLTGKAALTNGQTVSVTSDDGFRLIVDGANFSEFTGLRGPNNTTNATWTGSTGVYDVTLWYFEGQFTQAQLVSNLTPAPVPLPAAGALLLPALAGLGLLGARRRKAA